MCNNKQKVQTRISDVKWDNKFGIIEDNKTTVGSVSWSPDYDAIKQPNVLIKGVGKDAEIVTNAAGGKQSKSPMAMHLLDPTYLYDMARDMMDTLSYENEYGEITVDKEDREEYDCYEAIAYIAQYMQGIDDIRPTYLDLAMGCLVYDNEEQIMRIAKVLQYGADRYEPNNWRLIPQEEHINHALIHLIAHIKGDTQDEHLDHALCRLMMARATKRSEGFSYGSYVKTKTDIID